MVKWAEEMTNLYKKFKFNYRINWSFGCHCDHRSTQEVMVCSHTLPLPLHFYLPATKMYTNVLHLPGRSAVKVEQ